MNMNIIQLICLTYTFQFTIIGILIIVNTNLIGNKQEFLIYMTPLIGVFYFIYKLLR